ncbi:Hypothetical predicted protein [Cloeon dipterum]|uniref:C-type lectin domain-containing protein n=1 Tax=Cloeon dipterum TaxID=197152 RepID=A0A8S1DUY1_9INSE|nr:Hypothetical predicted protein [Cloeon dipterum]
MNLTINKQHISMKMSVLVFFAVISVAFSASFYGEPQGCSNYEIIQEEVQFTEAHEICGKRDGVLSSVMDRHFIQNCIRDLVPPFKTLWVQLMLPNSFYSDKADDDETQCPVAYTLPNEGLSIRTEDCTRRHYFVCSNNDINKI